MIKSFQTKYEALEREKELTKEFEGKVCRLTSDSAPGHEETKHNSKEDY